MRADERKPWTILFYLCGDNPLDGLDATIERELQQILGVGSSAEAHVAVQRDSPGGCGRWLLAEDQPGDVEQPTRTLGRAVDSASPDTLRDFLLWSLERCPSDCLALVVSGAGILDGRAIVGTATNDPDRVFTICDDWTERTGLEIRAFGEVLREVAEVRSRRGGAPRLELVAFDMCRMQFLEVAAELHESVEVLIGPQTDIDGWDYDSVLRTWLREIRDGWRAETDRDGRRGQLHALTERLVATIGRAYMQGWGARTGATSSDDDRVVVSALDLTQMERVMGAIDTMSLAYMQALGDRLAWDARVAAVTRLGRLQDRKSYDAHGIFREVSRALDQVDIDAGIAAYTMRWMCQAEPRELLRVLAVMDEALTRWLLEDADADLRRMGARRRLLEHWVRPACEEIRSVLDQYEGQSASALDEYWARTRTTQLDALAVEFGFPSFERLLLVIASQQQAWHERHRPKRSTDVTPGTGPGVSTTTPGTGSGVTSCEPAAATLPTPLLTARELADPAKVGPLAASTGIEPHSLHVWVQLLERCAADATLPAYARAELVALLRERRNARHLRRLVGRARMLLAPPRPGRRRGRLILSVFPPPAPPPPGDRPLEHLSGLSLYRPLDLAELTRASYLALQFNQRLHWTALLTAIHLIADRPHQLWQVLSSLLASARERGRQELLAQLAGPDAVLRVGSQFKAFAPVPMVTLSLERDAQSEALRAASPEVSDDRDARPVYLSRLMSSGREAVIHEQRCRVNQALLDRLLRELDRAVGREDSAASELDALGSMLGEDILSALAEHLEGERQRAGSELVHLQLQLPRDLLHYPWEIVRDRHGTLGARYAVARQVFVDVGLSGGTRARRAPRRERLRVLIIGNPTGDLPWAAREAQRVLQAFRALQQESGFIDVDLDEDVFIDETVAVTDLREHLRSGRYDVIHFCGHAHFDEKRPERSAWILSDGALEAEQIRNTLRQSDSPPWLVYANACSAGRDATSAPFLQDVTGLASAFVNSGVAAYVGPLWPIPDGPAGELAAAFYDRLVVGRSTLGAALCDARGRLLAEGGYTWASMVLFGDSTATLMQRLGALLSSIEAQANLAVDRRAGAPPRPAPTPVRRSVSIPVKERSAMTPTSDGFVDTSRDATRAPALTPEQLRLLRGHVINLREGRFSASGRFSTDAADVDAIFANGLSEAWDRAVARNEPLHIVLWAHGGLIDEASGLAIAQSQVRWWLDNRVYPIFFVWETGFFDALQQILSGTRGLPRTRDIWDHTTDLAVEAAARGGGVGKIWGAMKQSAELAAGAGGAARYVAKKLAEFCRNRPRVGTPRVVVHACGHSAGSIFHAHFLPAAFEEGVPDVEGLYLLAPAVRCDTFKSTIARHVGNEIDRVSLFTMKRDYEEADSVGPVYRKSLLYLVSRALESEAVSPILGLETSLRADPDLVRLFGLGGEPSPYAEVIWSVTSATAGQQATTSKTHGGFDNNGPTMNSVLRRMLGRSDAESIIEFPREAEARAVAASAFSLPDIAATAPAAAPALLPASAKLVAATAVAAGGGAGRRRAMCVGIDDYASAPLAGCVQDATDWRDALAALGFETTLLTNRQATREAMLAGLSDLVSTAAPGDIVVFQYAGHGTQFEDLGDEPGDEDDGKDEAFCPADMDSGAYVIDDDVRAIFSTIGEGVNVTCFIDCCHSGSITRALGNPARPLERTGNVRPRFMRATEVMTEAHRAFRAKTKAKKSRKPSAALADMRHVVFSACQDREVAYESNGHGDFTLRAIELLRKGVDGVTYESFQQKVIAAFGEGRRQNPNLECAPGSRALALLQPFVAAAAAAAAQAPTREASPVAALSASASNREIAELLRRVADVID